MHNDSTKDPILNRASETPAQPQTPNEHVPPIEVPGRENTPEPIPVKDTNSVAAPIVLVKNGPKLI